MLQLVAYWQHVGLGLRLFVSLGKVCLMGIIQLELIDFFLRVGATDGLNLLLDLIQNRSILLLIAYF